MADKMRGVVGTTVHDEAGTACGVVRVTRGVVASMWRVIMAPGHGRQCA